LASSLPGLGDAFAAGKIATAAVGVAVAKSASHAVSSTAATAAKVEAAVVKEGQTVLGHFPEYMEKASELGARQFIIPEKIWNGMSDAERWTANTKFLDRTISHGDDIILATPLDKVRPGSYYARELEYLSSKGYRPSADGARLVPGGN
jgi:hypothetical protein